MIHFLIKQYLSRWDREIQLMKTDPEKCQRNELKSILSSHISISGASNGPRNIEYEQFKSEYSISIYSEYKEKIELILSQQFSSINSFSYVARSSGTSSGTYKFVPLHNHFIKKNLLRGSWYVLHSLYQTNQSMSVFNFQNLLVGGALYGKENGRIIGDISGIMISRIPALFRLFYTPDIKIATSPDWEYKIEKTAEAAVNAKAISLIGGTPTWVLSLFRKILVKTNRATIGEIWPNLQAYLHGGVDFSPYKEHFQQLIQIKKFRYLEIYNGTEGFYGFQDRLEEGILLMLSNHIFYEFITFEKFNQEEFEIIPIWQVETDIPYVILITTSYGFRRYVIGDIIQFVTRSPYRIKIAGRTSEYINAFGEDLLLYQAQEALNRLQIGEKVKINDFTIAPSYLNVHKKGFHEWYIEFEETPINLPLLEKKLDYELQLINANYAQKRSDNLALEGLKIKSLKPGSFEKYLNSVGKIGGQNKIPRLKNDRSLLLELDKFLIQSS